MVGHAAATASAVASIARAMVGFTRPLRDADVELFGSLGGRVTHRWDFINALAGILPDRSVPAFQSRSDVEYVQAHSVSCLAG